MAGEVDPFILRFDGDVQPFEHSVGRLAPFVEDEAKKASGALESEMNKAADSAKRAAKSTDDAWATTFKRFVTYEFGKKIVEQMGRAAIAIVETIREADELWLKLRDIGQEPGISDEALDGIIEWNEGADAAAIATDKLRVQIAGLLAEGFRDLPGFITAAATGLDSFITGLEGVRGQVDPIVEGFARWRDLTLTIGTGGLYVPIKGALAQIVDYGDEINQQTLEQVEAAEEKKGYLLAEQELLDKQAKAQELLAARDKAAVAAQNKALDAKAKADAEELKRQEEIAKEDIALGKLQEAQRKAAAKEAQRDAEALEREADAAALAWAKACAQRIEAEKKARIEALEDWGDVNKQTVEDAGDALADMNAKLKEASDALIQNIEDRAERMKEALREAARQGADVINAGLDALDTLAQRQVERYAEAASQSREQLDSLKTAQEELYEALNEADSEQERAELEHQIRMNEAQQDYAEKLAEKNAEHAEKAWRSSQNLALSQIAFQSSIAVMTALATLGPVLGGIAAAGIGITAAIQAGVVKSEPMPEFHTGGNVARPGFSPAPDAQAVQVTGTESVLTGDMMRRLVDALEQRGGPTPIVFNGRQLGEMTAAAARQSPALGAELRRGRAPMGRRPPPWTPR